MNKNLALGLVGLGILLLGFFAGSWHRNVTSPSSTGLFGATQTYPLHAVQNPTSLDQLFTWGVFENAGVSWFTGAVNASSTLTVAGAASFATTTLGGHLISGGGTPTAAVGGAGWTAGTLSGNDTAGSVSSTPAAATVGQITVNFATAFTAAPVCVITPAITGMTTSTAAVFVTSSVSAFSINYALTAAPVANRWNYHCTQ